MSDLETRCRDLLNRELYLETLDLLDETDESTPLQHALRGRALSGLQRFGEAKKCFQDALAVDGSCDDALAGLGLLAWLSGNNQVALRKFDEAVQAAPQDGRYRGLRGLVHSQLKNTSIALEDFQAAYDLGDRDPAPLLARAQILIARGDTETAKKILSLALENGAEPGAVASLEGALGRLTGDYKGALDNYRKALDADPSRVQLWWEVLGLVSQVDRGKFQEVVEEALTHHPDDERLLLLAAAKWREAGETQRAIQALEQALQRRPNSLVLLQFLGTYLREVGRMDESLVYFEQALQIDPDSAKAHFGKSLATPDRSESLDCSRRAAELEPQNVVFLYHHGAILSALGRYEEALAPLAKAIALDPGFWRAYHERSICYESMGRFTSAKEERKRCDHARARGHDLPADLDPMV